MQWYPQLDTISEDTKIFSVDNTDYNRSFTNEQIERTQGISHFSMSNTKLRGKIPPALWNLPFLEKLEVADNFVTGPLPSGPISKEIQLLHLENNRITGSIPDSLYNASKLSDFVSHTNKMNGTVSPNISNLKLLHRFKIDENNFSGTVPTELGSLPLLDDVSLSGTNLSGQIPSELCNRRMTASFVRRLIV
jgi:Leucine-rich repeat (LRR) protein